MTVGTECRRRGRSEERAEPPAHPEPRLPSCDISANNIGPYYTPGSVGDARSRRLSSNTTTSAPPGYRDAGRGPADG